MGLGEKGRVDLSEVIRDQLYFAPLHWTEDSVVLFALPQPDTAFCIDDELNPKVKETVTKVSSLEDVDNDDLCDWI
ncbi:unnamed protein product [Calypogeia fissa]